MLSRRTPTRPHKERETSTNPIKNVTENMRNLIELSK